MRTISARLSPVASSWERACQLFYQLKGGRVDYGQGHARAFNVERFGHDFGEGLYPKWNSENPVHLVGHSFGGQTARALQQMLEDGEFAGYDTSARWVLSIACISSPLNGSLAVYPLGAKSDVLGAWVASILERTKRRAAQRRAANRLGAGFREDDLDDAIRTDDLSCSRRGPASERMLLQDAPSTRTKAAQEQSSEHPPEATSSQPSVRSPSAVDGDSTGRSAVTVALAPKQAGDPTGATRPADSSTSKWQPHLPVRWFSAGFSLGVLIQGLEFLDSPALRGTGLDFVMQHHRLSRRHGVALGCLRLLRALNPCSRGSRLFQNTNTAPFDLSVHGSFLWNARIKHYHHTYYFSFVGDGVMGADRGLKADSSRGADGPPAAQRAWSGGSTGWGGVTGDAGQKAPRPDSVSSGRSSGSASTRSLSSLAVGDLQTAVCGTVIAGTRACSTACVPAIEAAPSSDRASSAFTSRPDLEAGLPCCATASAGAASSIDAPIGLPSAQSSAGTGTREPHSNDQPSRSESSGSLLSVAQSDPGTLAPDSGWPTRARSLRKRNAGSSTEAGGRGRRGNNCALSALLLVFSWLHTVFGWIGAMITTAGVVRDLTTWTGRVFWAAGRSLGSWARCSCCEAGRGSISEDADAVVGAAGATEGLGCCLGASVDGEHSDEGRSRDGYAGRAIMGDAAGRDSEREWEGLGGRIADAGSPAISMGSTAPDPLPHLGWPVVPARPDTYVPLGDSAERMKSGRVPHSSCLGWAAEQLALPAIKTVLLRGMFEAVRFWPWVEEDYRMMFPDFTVEGWLKGGHDGLCGVRTQAFPVVSRGSSGEGEGSSGDGGEGGGGARLGPVPMPVSAGGGVSSSAISHQQTKGSQAGRSRARSDLREWAGGRHGGSAGASSTDSGVCLPAMPRRWVPPHRFGPLPTHASDVRPGTWYVRRVGVDHVSIVPAQHDNQAQQALFKELFAGLRRAEERWTAMRAAGEQLRALEAEG